MKCSTCGEPNDPGLKYCVACGQPLVRDPEKGAGPENEPSFLPSGTILKSTYEIISPLGEGGAGAVYQGRHVDLGHPVAIKVLFGHLARTSSIRDRFVEEGRIQANLRHPNIVQVHDIIDEGGRVAIVMEYIDGESLHAFIHRQRDPVPVPFAVHLTLRLLSGLACAHASGIIHRDIKPGNVLLAHTDGGMVPKLCDFGIAKVKAARGRTVTGTKMGTVYYMAPEQFEDARTVDTRADIYSLGVTLYELLTQRLPFESENEFAIIRAHLEVSPPSPRGYRPDLPSELDRLLLKALAKRPEDRFESCEAMTRALIALPGFETLKGYASDPALVETERYTQRRGPEARPSPELHRPGPERAARGGEGAPRQRPPQGQEMTALASPKEAARHAARRIPWFSIFLGAFAVALAMAVFLWWLTHRQVQEDIVSTRPDPSEGTVAAAGTVELSLHEITAVGALDIVDDVEQVYAQAEELSGLPGEVPEALSAEHCRFLADQATAVLSFSSTDVSFLSDALEQVADSCRPTLMQSVSENRFDMLWAQVQADRLNIARHLSRAYQDQNSEQRCFRLALANRAYDRAIQRIEAELGSGQMLELESAPVRDMGRELVEGQARLHARFPECQW